MAIKRLSFPNRDDVIKYIEATLFGGMTKKDAYMEYINPDIKNVHGAITTMENKKEFKDLYQALFSDDALKAQHTIQRVRNKFAGLVENNIDATSKILQDVMQDDKASQRSKSGAVRLANETISAMAVIQGATPVEQDGNKKLNRGSVVI